MDNSKYIFVKPQSDKITVGEKPQKFADKTRKFYQICQYPFINDKYYVKVYYINEYCNIIKNEIRIYARYQLDRLIKLRRSNSYKIYGTSDVSNISEPQPGFFCEAQSELLNNNEIVYDYAKF